MATTLLATIILGRLVLFMVPSPNCHCFVSHGPEAAVGLDKETMLNSGGNGDDIAGDDLFGRLVLYRCRHRAGRSYWPHSPEAAISLHEETVAISRAPPDDVAGNNLLWLIRETVRCSIAQLTAGVNPMPHRLPSELMNSEWSDPNPVASG